MRIMAEAVPKQPRRRRGRSGVEEQGATIARRPEQPCIRCRAGILDPPPAASLCAVSAHPAWSGASRFRATVRQPTACRRGGHPCSRKHSPRPHVTPLSPKRPRRQRDCKRRQAPTSRRYCSRLLLSLVVAGADERIGDQAQPRPRAVLTGGEQAELVKRPAVPLLLARPATRSGAVGEDDTAASRGARFEAEAGPAYPVGRD
jgi:hypothetical protein